MELNLEQLVRFAYTSGASDAKIISADDITVEDRLAKLCSKSQCQDYALSPSCPPHVSGPDGFRELQQNMRHALVLRISVPSAALFSDERREIMRLLHEIVAGIEQAAIKMGFGKSMAFAGGSCKTIFCHDRTECASLSQGGTCRYPQLARPSMSGFGINVLELMKVCGWPANFDTNGSEADTGSMSWVAGLILMG